MADDDARNDEPDEGLSTPQKVLAGAALGVAVPAAVGVARKMLGGSGDADDDGATSSEPTTRERRSTAKAKPKAKPKAKAKAKAKPSRASSTTTRAKPKRTREQLYRQATRLKIDGRSSMSKAQLERAVERAKSK